MLNTSLAAAESMTHDVIRDLLGIKLDMTNYADMIDQHQVKKLVEEAYQYREEIFAKEQEILKLKEQINGLIEERESCVSERDKKELDILAAQISLEQLKERDQLLCAQNEMLKMDKANLKRRIIELDQMVKTLLETQTTQQQLQQNLKVKNDGVSKSGDSDLNKRLAHSEWLLSQVNDELAAHCRRSSNTHVRKGLMGKVMKQEIGGRKS
ncbi:kinesin-like protein KIN-12C isoform X1 [Carica papaya]|uniref:kinesin-like protein KIN-12C isoform X1 n=1 Tax=Carica papaya TaxID=3649 RepID=UPI000B8CF082|nr:kinesin-like protein KIN-12C isoform X1 [Carica papaya]XP_021889523.1 kinesin-like protein KIN-12C isoform X1 [Carica papaya]